MADFGRASLLKKVKHAKHLNDWDIIKSGAVTADRQAQVTYLNDRANAKKAAADAAAAEERKQRAKNAANRRMNSR